MVEIYWLGHASVLIEAGKRKIFVDPWKLSLVSPADLVLVTHEHYDHCSDQDISKIAGSQTPVLGPSSAVKKITKGQKVVLKPGEDYKLDWVTIEGTPAYNLDKPFHPEERQGLGFLIKLPENSIYVAGDTDLIPEMKQIHPDIALVPVGGTYTMDASQAAEAVSLLKPKIAIPIHFGDIVGSRKQAEEFQRLVKEVRVEILTAGKPFLVDLTN